MKELKGALVALVTPFKKGKVDFRVLKKLVDWQIREGTDGIVPCGTTGESPTLSHDEHHEVVAAVVAAAAGRVPVIAGTGSNSTEEAVSLTRHAKRAGADACLSVVPYYNKPTQAGQYEHFKEVCKKAGLPVVLYNIPGRCGSGLTADTVERLADIDLIIGIKEATGSMDMTSEILLRTDLAVLSGDDSLTIPLMALGACGVISVIANLFPRRLSRMVNDYLAGRHQAARLEHFRMFPLCKALFTETNPIPVKTAMSMMGLDSGAMRLPLVPMAAKNAALLRKRLSAYKREKI